MLTRCFSLLLGVSTLLFAPAAMAIEPTPVGTAPAAGERAPAIDNELTSARPLPCWGAMLDVGAPDGATASVVARPLRWLRLHAGAGTNSMSAGVRGGVTVVPFAVGPSLTLEAGHYAEGNANQLTRRLGIGGSTDNPTLARVGYDYVNAHAGVELGLERVVFFLRGGFSYIGTRLHDVGGALQGATPAGQDSSQQTTIIVKQDPSIRVITPSAKLGLVVYIW